jgi:predicted metal-dependent peptidase
MPDAEYAILKVKNPWIVAPQPGVMGWNGRVPAGKTQIIYLPEFLEGIAHSELKLLLAHELAHSVLGHTDSPSDDPANEDVAWQKVIDWKIGESEEVAKFREKYNQLSSQRVNREKSCDDSE